jgi:hypothetical protein
MTVSTLDRTDVASEMTDARPLLHRAPTRSAARRRLPFWWRTTLGLLFGAGALVIPWVGLNLNADLTAFNIKLSFAAVPLIGHLSYGEVLLPIIAAVAVSSVRSRGRPTNVTRACGWAMILVSLIFVVATRIMGGELLFRLSNDLAQTQIVDRQLGYRFAPPPSFLGFTPDSTTMMVLNGLQVGWYLTLLAGGLMAGRSVTPLRRRRTSVIALVAIGIVLVWGFTSGLLAQAAKFDGVAAEQVGHPVLAEHDFARALSLNPELRYDNELEVELGHAQADQAHVNALTWLAAAENPPPTTNALYQQIFDFSQALAAAPDNPLVRSDFAVSLADDMNSTGAPLAPGSVSKLDGLPFLSFTSGHYAFEAGDESSAIAYLDQTVADTGNGELLSAAYTYLALSEQRLGATYEFREDIVKAVDLDSQDINALAREIAAGLLTPGTP